MRSQFSNSNLILPISEWINRDEIIESLITAIDREYDNCGNYEAVFKTKVLVDLLAEYYCRVYGKYFDVDGQT